MLRRPEKVVRWERLTHGPSIQIVGVQVHDIVLVLSRVITRYIRVVCLAVTIADHGNTARIPSSTKKYMFGSVNNYNSTSVILRQADKARPG